MKKYQIEQVLDGNGETRYYILERWLGFFWRYKIKYTLGGRQRCSYYCLQRAEEAVQWFERTDRSNKLKRVRIVR